MSVTYTLEYLQYLVNTTYNKKLTSGMCRVVHTAQYQAGMVPTLTKKKYFKRVFYILEKIAYQLVF